MANSDEHLLEVALGCFDRGDFVNAKGHLGELLALGIQDARIDNLTGRVCQELGEFEEAIDHYKRAINLSPDNYLSFGGLGESLLHVGKMHEAIVALGKRANISPTAQSFVLLAFAQSSNQQFEDAQKSCYSALARDPDYDEAFINLGVIHFSLEAFHKANLFFQVALSLRPDSQAAKKWISKSAKKLQENASSSKDHS